MSYRPSTAQHDKKKAKQQKRENVIKGRVGTYSKGASGKLKILQYNIEKLVRTGGILTTLSLGTVFTLDWTIRKVLRAHLLVAIGGVVVVFADSHMTAKDVDGLKALSSYLGGFVPFVLGLYISITLARWWALRTLALAPVYDAVSNISLMVSVFLPNKEELREVRERLLKYGMACVVLVVQAARDQDNLGTLLEQKFLTEKEVSLIERFPPFQRAMMMWSWIPRVMFHAFELYEIPWPVYTNVLKLALAARVAIQNIHTYLWTQIPFAYVHLINILVNTQNAVNSAKCGMLIGIAARELWFRDGLFTLYYTMAAEILTWFVTPVIYHGLLVISYIVQDPFGEDILDFPIKAWSEEVLDNCRALYVARDCPSELDLFSHVKRLAHHKENFEESVYDEPDEPTICDGSSATGDGTSAADAEPVDQGPTLEEVVTATLTEATAFLEKLESKLPALDAYMAYCGLAGLTLDSEKHAEATKKMFAYSEMHPAVAKMAQLANEMEVTSKESAVRLLECVDELQSTCEDKNHGKKSHAMISQDAAEVRLL